MIVKAYGKILVFGAYSILEPGNVGLVVNINKGTTTKLTETDKGQVVVDLKNFKIKVKGVKEGHRLFFKKNPEVIKYLKNAIEYSYKFLNHKGIKIKNISLESENDSEFSIGKIKTGFGSSASSTVSTVVAILKLHGYNDKDIVYKISRYSHYKSQGSGSGFDIAASCFGCHFIDSKNTLKEDFFDNLGTEKETVKEFYWPYELHAVVAFTGQAASTHKLVSKILNFKKRKPDEYASIMIDYNDINIECVKAFLEMNFDKIEHYLDRSWLYRKKLGILSKADIESDRMTSLIDEIKVNGALAAGLIGAGGGDSILCLCKEENKKNLTKFLNDKNLYVFDIKLVSKEYEFL